MSEEKKQEAKEVTPEQAAAPAEGAAAPKGKTPVKVEIPKNCGACKKPIHKVRYYRNMQFFCNRKCWETFKTEALKKQKEAEQKQQEQAA
ncbi:MAG: hypothetical protein PHV59_05835 [Victivallales bacterium]|nr:hypothetical protein [Victivallales bacterium]